MFLEKPDGADLQSVTVSTSISENTKKAVMIYHCLLSEKHGLQICAIGGGNPTSDVYKTLPCNFGMV